jgi:predicted ATPase
MSLSFISSFHLANIRNAFAMHLRSLTIRNFRALQDIRLDFDALVSVIVGPNAIGKTTILEAIRFAKALLAPRTASETTQIMVSLGVSSPHMPQSFSFASIARDLTLPIEVNCRYALSTEELGQLSASVNRLASSLVQAQIGQAFGNPAAIIQYLSSDQGKEMLGNAEKSIRSYLDKMDAQGHCRISLTVDSQGNARGSDQFAQLIVSALDQGLAPAQTKFSYFPADRALPAGEAGVQLGGADAAQQLEAHNAQPQLKYGRLKNTIFGAIAQDEEGRSSLRHEFEEIFGTVLRGRRLDFVGINERGTLSIKVADTATGRTFDIDGMSSGEKGLILTFLLMSRSMARDGLLLLDEPELHLNPAVCKDVLGFLVAKYAVPKNLQILICTHSPEILASAFDQKNCALFHLRSETEITKVRFQDENEVASALQRLGSSQSESLLYRGTVFVEGPTDVDLLELGFPAAFNRYRIKDLGGRSEVEKEIKRLQKGESEGQEFPLTLFIFDLDKAPSTLQDSKLVKTLQWRRRTIENYFSTLTSLQIS